MINKMDMMPKDHRDMHTDTFRQDQQDDHDFDTRRDANSTEI